MNHSSQYCNYDLNVMNLVGVAYEHRGCTLYKVHNIHRSIHHSRYLIAAENRFYILYNACKIQLRELEDDSNVMRA